MGKLSLCSLWLVKTLLWNSREFISFFCITQRVEEWGYLFLENSVILFETKSNFSKVESLCTLQRFLFLCCFVKRWTLGLNEYSRDIVILSQVRSSIAKQTPRDQAIKIRIGFVVRKISNIIGFSLRGVKSSLKTEQTHDCQSKGFPSLKWDRVVISCGVVST